MEEIYDTVDSVCNITVVNDRGSSRSKKRLIVGLISLGILSVGLLIGLIRLGFLSHALSSSAAGLSGTKDNLTDRHQDGNDQLSIITEERDRLNAALTEMSNEMIRLQSLLNNKETCPAGWMLYFCSCYFHSTSSGSWDKAREDCRNRGGDLVVIKDDYEQVFFSEVLDEDTWIGLNDIESEGSWKWVDGTPLTHRFNKYWANDHPDNGGGDPRRGEEDCAFIGTDELWNDRNCSDSLQWLCEKDTV